MIPMNVTVHEALQAGRWVELPGQDTIRFTPPLEVYPGLVLGRVEKGLVDYWREAGLLALAADPDDHPAKGNPGGNPDRMAPAFRPIRKHPLAPPRRPRPIG